MRLEVVEYRLYIPGAGVPGEKWSLVEYPFDQPGNDGYIEARKLATSLTGPEKGSEPR